MRLEEMIARVASQLQAGPIPLKSKYELFPKQHPEAVDRAFLALMREGRIAIKGGSYHEVVLPESEETLDALYAGHGNHALMFLGYKRCSYCKHVKEFDDFYKSKLYLTGLTSWCVECTQTKRHEYEARKSAGLKLAKPAPEIPLGMKRCRQCKTEKPYTDFLRLKRSPDLHHTRCRDCCARNRERQRERVKEYLGQRAA